MIINNIKHSFKVVMLSHLIGITSKAQIMSDLIKLSSYSVRSSGKISEKSFQST